MRTNDEIIDVIIALKDEKGWSLSELARRVGFAKSGLSRYFNKTREFPLNKVEIFAKALNVTPEYILGFDGTKFDRSNEKKIESKSVPDPNWRPEITVKDEKNIERQLEALLDGTSEQGSFAAYDGKRPDEMTAEEFENHILFKNALRETLRIAKKINKEKHTPNKYRKGAD